MIAFFKKQPLIGFALLFLLWRMIFLLFLHPFHLFVYSEEELYRGAFAKDLIEGLKLSLLQYRADDFATGGFYIISFLVSICFRIFGSTLFALKLAPIFLSLGSLLCFYRVFRDYLGQKAANIFSLLFIFAPFNFMWYTMAPLGDHAETIFFTALSLHLFFRILEGNNPLRNAFLLGIVAGLGLWYAYVYLLTIVVLMAYWFLINRCFFKHKPFALFILGFVIGFSPWILINFATGFAGLQIRDTPVTDFFSLSNLIPTLDTLRVWSPVKFLGLFIPYHMSNWIVKTYLFLLVGLFGYVASIYLINLSRSKCPSAPKIPTHPIVIAVAYVALLLIALQLSEYRFIRYAIPAFPFMLVIIAFGLTQIESHYTPKHQQAPFYIFILLLVLNIVGSISLLSPAHAGHALKTSGHSYFRLPYLDYCIGDDACIENYKKLRPNFSEYEKRKIPANFGLEISNNRIDYENLEKDYQDMQAKIPAEMKKYFDYFLGKALFRYHGSWEKAQAAVAFLERFPAPSHLYVQVGIIDELGFQPYFELTEKQAFVLEEKIPTVIRPYYWRSIATKIMRTWQKESKDTSKALTLFLKNISMRYPTDFLEGVGLFIYRSWKPTAQSPYFDPSFARSFSDPYQKAIFRGIGMGFELNELVLHQRDWLKNDLLKNLSEAERENTLDGMSSIKRFF